MFCKKISEFFLHSKRSHSKIVPNSNEIIISSDQQQILSPTNPIKPFQSDEIAFSPPGNSETKQEALENQDQPPQNPSQQIEKPSLNSSVSYIFE
jgi:hypothetical protein